MVPWAQRTPVAECTEASTMTSKWLPAVFLVGGLVMKGLLLAVWKRFNSLALLNLLTTYDPGAFWFAEKTTALLFDQRRIYPTYQEAIAFELLLVVGFGLECLLVGMVVTWFLRRRRMVEPR